MSNLRISNVNRNEFSANRVNLNATFADDGAGVNKYEIEWSCIMMKKIFIFIYDYYSENIINEPFLSFGYIFFFHFSEKHVKLTDTWTFAFDTH